MAKASTSNFRITSSAVQTRVIGIAVSTLVLIAAAHADIIFTQQNLNQFQDTVNVSMSNSPPSSGTPVGMPIQGTVPHLDGTVAVEFTSTVDSLFARGNGICGVPCSTAELHDVTLELPGWVHAYDP